ncbi:MAG: hypothetical protein ABL995_03780 [Bryobacteraceae bacterium]
MRLFSIAALSVLTCGLALAATTRDATYVVGNLEGVEAGSDGLITVDNNQLIFRSGKITVEVPYKKLTLVELGATLTHSVDVPIYRVWQLHKRLLAEKPTFQNLTLNFTDADGKEQSMTLELLEGVALQTHDYLLVKTGRKPKRPQEDWWGDSYWRTTRSSTDWDKRNADDQPVKPDTDTATTQAANNERPKAGK